MSGRKAHARRKHESRGAHGEMVQLYDWLDQHGVARTLPTGEELNALGRVKTLLASWKRNYEAQIFHQTESRECADQTGSATEAAADQTASLGALAGVLAASEARTTS